MRRFCDFSTLATRVMAVALVVALAVLPACKNNGQPSPSTSPGTAGSPAASSTVTIDTGEQKLVFHVELAITPAEFQRGLMFRTQLAPDAGMLFVSKYPQAHTFWMKNTLIPLDMIFIGTDQRIVGIVENAEPQTLTERRVPGLSQYVLEIGGGVSGRMGIRAGQRVVFQGVPVPIPD
jgi:uncharacterized membrane protein (UPF0127 family)